MAIVRYSETDEYDLVNSGQDCMGWTVVDQAGNDIGKVKDMLINTKEMRVDSVVIGDGVRVQAENIALIDNRVVARGVLDQDKYAKTRKVAEETTTTTYEAAPPRDAETYHVEGVTRQANEDEITIPIIEEQLVVGKQIVEKGGVRIRTGVEEREVSEDVTLREEHVEVKRHAVDRPVDADAIDSLKEGSVEVTTQAEVAVVQKDARVVEEVVVGKEVVEHDETVSDTVKRTEVDVEEIDAEKTRAERN